MGKEHILVFEPLSGGHRSEFVDHLLGYIRGSNPTNTRYTFVVGKRDASVSAVPTQVNLREITAQEEQVLARSTGPLGGFATWRVLKAYLKELKPDHVILMDLTWVELPLCFVQPPCTFSGILFVQYPELCSAPKTRWRRWAKFWFKDIKTHRFLHNRRLRRIYLLNGAYSCNFLNNRFGVACYHPISDPVPALEPDPNTDLRRDFGIESGRRLFLFFGSMSARKGVEALTAAIGSLPKETAEQSAFVFCGLPEAGYEKRYQECIDRLVRERPDVCLRTAEGFITSSRMRALFEQADWILLPYTRPEYSSGILAHAAAARTPVIGPADGLVGRLIREYGLGEGVSSDTFTRAIEKAVAENHVFNESSRQAFVDASNPEQFAASLLDI